MARKKLLFALVVFLLFGSNIFIVNLQAAQKKVKLKFWHAMSGSRLQAVENLVTAFNAHHANIEIIAQFTGTYAETMTKAISATRAGNPPHIIQVYEVGTQTLLDSKAFIPVFEIARPGEIDFDDIIAPIRKYYSVAGKLYSMPFNSSTAILYYNKAHFKKAGLDPNKPPGTYREISEMGQAILASGAAPNVLSFGWPAWIFEQTHALHNQFYANNANGRSGRATEVLFNKQFGVKVLQQWTDWSRSNIYIYGGREYSANKAFISGQIAMLIQSTSSVASIQRAAKFEVGTGTLPRLEGYEQGSSVIGGATLWIMKGLSDKEKDGVREFMHWVIDSEVVKQWHKDTGYLPLINSSIDELVAEGWFKANPNHYTALMQILSGKDTPQAQGVLLGNFVQIRDIVDSALEKAFQGVLTPKQALDEAAENANRVLREYNQLYD